MPLQKSIILDNGIELASAYIVINKLEFNYPISTVNIFVGIYKDSAAYAANKPEVLYYNHTCSGDDFTTYFAEGILALVNNTPLTRGYTWLLTLPIYSGATRV
jgi:hypothetical protein